LHERGVALLDAVAGGGAVAVERTVEVVDALLQCRHGLLAARQRCGRAEQAQQPGDAAQLAVQPRQRRAGARELLGAAALVELGRGCSDCLVEMG
jgi:hypothetical protein